MKFKSREDKPKIQWCENRGRRVTEGFCINACSIKECPLSMPGRFRKTDNPSDGQNKQEKKKLQDNIDRAFKEQYGWTIKW